MKRILFVVLAGLVGSVFGYFIAQRGDQELGTPLAIDRNVPSKTTYSCRAKSYAAVLEAGPLTKAFAGSGGTDRVSIKIEPQSQKFSTIMGAAIELGRFDPAEHLIIKNNRDIVVATSFEDQTHVHAFYFDKKDSLLMWTKTSMLLGLKGHSMLFECD